MEAESDDDDDDEGVEVKVDAEEVGDEDEEEVLTLLSRTRWSLRRRLQTRRLSSWVQERLSRCHSDSEN